MNALQRSEDVGVDGTLKHERHLKLKLKAGARLEFLLMSLIALGVVYHSRGAMAGISLSTVAVWGLVSLGIILQRRYKVPDDNLGDDCLDIDVQL